MLEKSKVGKIEIIRTDKSSANILKTVLKILKSLLKTVLKVP